MSYPLFLTVTTVTVTSSLFSLFPYEALQCHAKFVIHSEGIAVDAEILANLHRLEVRPKTSIVPTGDGDELTVEDMQVALASRNRLRLDERVVSVEAEELVDDGIRVAAQHARNLLTGCHHVAATKDGLQVATEVCVGVPTLLLRFYLGCVFSVSTSKRFITFLQIIFQDFSCEARAVLCFRPYASSIVFLHIASGKQD